MASLFSKVHILYLALYVAAHHTVKFTHEISTIRVLFVFPLIWCTHCVIFYKILLELPRESRLTEVGCAAQQNGVHANYTN